MPSHTVQTVGIHPESLPRDRVVPNAPRPVVAETEHHVFNSSSVAKALKLGSCAVAASSDYPRVVLSDIPTRDLGSILSPPDPSADETARSPPGHSVHSTPKRKFEEAFRAGPTDTLSVPPTPPLPPPPLAYHNHSIKGFVPVGGTVTGHGPAHDDNRSSAGRAMMTVVDDKKAVIKRQPMRSSIACLRCRKSKIKCDNDGGSSPCETCIKQGKDCKYPEATPMPPKRSEPPTGMKVERDNGVDRKRIKKEDMSRAGGQSSAIAHADEILSAHYLTPKLWSEVFDIYRLHFATELPFLHMPTIKESMVPRFKETQRVPSPDTNLVLLGVLTLTARFHPDLVKYATHTASSQAGAARNRPVQSKPDSSAASEFFAEALRKAMGPLGTTMTTASVERVQAFLMLGLYEWSQVQPKTGGLGAWMYVGVAIRMAQALRLGLGDQSDSRCRSRTNRSRIGSPDTAPPPPELTIRKEIKRRTMFSCLILDRLLACGKERVSTIRSEDLQIQLPCNEWAFDLSKEVKTGFLNGPPDKNATDGAVDDSVLSRFVRLVDLWGEISKFSFSGGRLVEDHPPWDPRTRFYQLRERLEGFYADLPSTFTLSTSNYHRHENHQASSVYVSLHMLGSVCQIMLHREYIPFLPIRCEGPVGPLDEPMFPASEYDIPEGFWVTSAEHVFKAGKDIVDIIDICRDKLPMSALVLFTVWTAAYVGQYAWHFPHMDQKRHMLVDNYGEDNNSYALQDMTKVGPTGICYETLGRFAGWLKMASTYLGYFKDLDDYMTKVKNEYYEHVHSSTRAKVAPKDDGKHPISGGGLEEWKIQNSKIINNGMIMAEDDRHGGCDGSDRSRASTIERGSSTGPDCHHVGKTLRSTPSMFVAINSMPAPPPQQQQQHYDSPHSGPSPRTKGLPDPGPGRPFADPSRAGPPSQHIHPSPIHTHHSLPGSAGGEPNVMPEDQFMDLLSEGESMRIAEALEDIQVFSYGDVDENAMLFGQSLMPFGPLADSMSLRGGVSYPSNGSRDDGQRRGGKRDVIANLAAFPF
ncbi:putative transcriptional regulatory protein PB1A11.04c [Cytospora mali]|uniref:Transcriptional regulatory protein PB1A11.04c n=1 Tax=Cytospora mali TaxID=578113 RepID=A0A194VV67_CYTMA|nr:putative transcriptional regulatory protein PB1A11.04c [Valsa mali]